MNLIPTHVLATVDDERLQRGVEGLASGAYSVPLTRLTEQEISAFVTNGDGKSYSVTLTEGRAFCACSDAMFRGKTCKHATALAFAIRAPQLAVNAESQHDMPPSDLRLAKVRRSSL